MRRITYSTRAVLTDDPLGIAPQIAGLEDDQRRLWRLIDANERGYRRNDAALRAELAALDAELGALRELRLTAHRADIAANRAPREGRAA